MKYLLGGLGVLAFLAALVAAFVGRSIGNAIERQEGV